MKVNLDGFLTLLGVLGLFLLGGVGFILLIVFYILVYALCVCIPIALGVMTFKVVWNWI